MLHVFLLENIFLKRFQNKLYMTLNAKKKPETGFVFVFLIREVPILELNMLTYFANKTPEVLLKNIFNEYLT